jgi:hypothetical protein
MKKILLYSFVVLLLIVVVIASVCFKPLDETPYTDAAFYKEELSIINRLEKNHFSDDTLEAGWAKVNLLPAFSTPIAIDAKRGGKHFEGVRDSVFVRAFVFKQGDKKVAFISADLLIIPPSVTRLFQEKMKAGGFDNNNIFFTATHTHTGIGAWQNSYVGEVFAGKYDERVPAHIANCIEKAILNAEQNLVRTQIGFAEVPTQKLVFNRLVKEKGEVDSLVRIVKLVNDSGQAAAIITFAAHATIFHEKEMRLSGDWPGAMMTQLESAGKISFASFSAGAVGSHGPFEHSKNQEEELKYMADGVSAAVINAFDSIGCQYITALHMQHVPLHLRQPNMRVANKLVVRPWLFKKLLGDDDVFVNTLQIGNVFFAGMPCDFSGELSHQIDAVATLKNKHLMLTSFNGGYIGYVTHSKWYGMNAYETRTMGWFGPQTGDYLSEVVVRLVSR